ncbi:nitric oxide-sensing protein NosP [Billgrantia antri]|uniref:FIST C-terminal domain-containing protein n=1 Tax=Billgrantia antri TaxID=2846777 RepID=A0ABS6ZIN1_9GAMM|nr:nitric oxide-sensing protein NosP [Halomonas antri]MBW6389911.1 FIST C-terminal domain-containing protein [Halomonas antri]
MDIELPTPYVTANPDRHEAVLVAHSGSRDPDMAAQDLASRLLHPCLGGVLFFCSAEYDLEALGQAMEQHFGGVTLCGCTTAGEITDAGYGRGGITAIGFDQRDFALDHALLDDLDQVSLLAAQQLTDGLLERCRQAGIAPIKGHTFALTLLDGLSASEERVLATLNAALGSIPHFGGSAGDDNRLSGTHVYGNGRFRTGAAVVIMINTTLDFEVFTTHHLRPLDDKLVVTAADREHRRVIELNAEPAAEEYARLVGCRVDELDEETFARHPLAVRLHDHAYVRSIQRVNEDLSLSFYCAVENGIVLTAMRAAPILDDLRAALDEIRERLGPPRLVIGCDCFLRRLEIEADGIGDAASALLRDYRVVGFNTYGEQCNGMHLNQTFTGVVIGQLRRSNGSR